VKLFFKISNLCDHDTSASRTDRRLAVANTALCVASHGKNTRHRGRAHSRSSPHSEWL